MKKSLKVLFLGAGDIAVPTFRWLLNSDYDCVGLVTQPDKRYGRKQELRALPIKEAAIQAKVPVFQPHSCKDSNFLEQIKSLKADVYVVMAYGQILPVELIEQPSLACINLHASLLPKYRGASCIQAAIKAGDKQTGITVMHVVKELDAGAMIYKQALELHQESTAEQVHDDLADISPICLDEVLAQFDELGADVPAQEQNLNEVTYIGKLNREDGQINWNQSALDIDRMIRAYHTWPGTYTSFVSEQEQLKKLKIYPHVQIVNGANEHAGTIIDQDKESFTVQCGVDNQAVKITGDIQLEGSKKMPVAAFLLGHQLPDFFEK